MKEFSIVLPTRLRHETLLRALDSCLDSARARDSAAASVEIIVVGSGADEALAEKLAPYVAREGVRFATVAEAGANRARNRGVELAQGRYIYFLDDDCFMAGGDSFRLLRRLFRQYPGTTGFGGYYLTPPRASLPAFYFNHMSNTWLDLHRTPDGNSSRLLGGNACVRRDIFDAGFRFSEAIEYGGAETELQARLAAAGHSFRVDERLSVFHAPGAGWAGVAGKAWRQSAGRARLAAKLRADEGYGRKIAGAASLRTLPLLPYFAIGQAAYLATRVQDGVVGGMRRMRAGVGRGGKRVRQLREEKRA